MGYINEWGQFVDSDAVVSGATSNYGGATDYPKRWAEQKQGGTDQTAFQANERTAPQQNLATRVKVTRANDLPIISQDLNKAQIKDEYLYPGTQTNKTATEPPPLTWNGFAWVSTQGWSSETFESFGGEV